MQYNNPLHIISDLLVDTSLLSESYLKQLRKQRLLELQMFGNELKVKDKVYTKDDIIKAFDELENPERLKYHGVIWKNKDLHEYLVSGDVKHIKGIQDSFQYDPALKDIEFYKGFKKFLSPYLAERIKRISVDLIKDEDYATLTKHTELLVYVNLEYREEALSNIKYQLDYFIEKLDALEHERIQYQEEEFKVFTNTDLYLFLNTLPEEMGKTINQFTREVINSCVTIEKKQLNYVWKVYKGFRLINCEESLKTLIESNYKVYKRLVENKNNPKPIKKNSPVVTKKKKSGRSSWTTIGFIVLVIFLAIRFIRIFTKPSYKKYDTIDLNDITKNFGSDHSSYSSNDNADFVEVLNLLMSEEKEGEEVPNLFSTIFRDENIPTYGEDIEINNQSPYDLRVLVDGTLGFYASDTIKANTKTKIPYINGKFVVYAGNDWDDSHVFYGKKESLMGGFTKIDDNSRVYLKEIFPNYSGMTRIELKMDHDSLIVERRTSYGDIISLFEMSKYKPALYASHTFKKNDTNGIDKMISFEKAFPSKELNDKKDETDPVKVFNLTTQDLIVLNDRYYNSSRSEIIKSMEAGTVENLGYKHYMYLGKNWNKEAVVSIYPLVGGKVGIKGRFDSVTENGLFQLTKPYEKKYSADEVLVYETVKGQFKVVHNDRLSSIMKHKIIQEYISVVDNANSETTNWYKPKNSKILKDYSGNFNQMFDGNPKSSYTSTSARVYNKTNYDIRILSPGFLELYASKVIEANKSQSYTFTSGLYILVGKKWDDSKAYADGEKLYFGGFEELHPNFYNIASSELKLKTYDIKSVTIIELDGKITVKVDYDYSKDATYTL